MRGDASTSSAWATPSLASQLGAPSSPLTSAATGLPSGRPAVSQRPARSREWSLLRMKRTSLPCHAGANASS